MPKLIDLTGRTFGNLTVIKRVKDHITPKGTKIPMWECICNCGNKDPVIVRGDSLRNGSTKSCGCLAKKYREEFKTINYKHGGSSNGRQTKLYSIWHGMKNRVTNPKQNRHESYIDKGINICDEWFNSFENFQKWALNNGYQEGLSIERIDIDKDYCPENCIWIPFSEQSKNTSRTINILVDNKRLCLKDCCKKFGLPYASVAWAIHKKDMSPSESVYFYANKNNISLNNHTIKDLNE